MHSAHEGKNPKQFWAPHLAGFNEPQDWFLCPLYGNSKPLFTESSPAELPAPQLLT